MIKPSAMNANPTKEIGANLSPKTRTSKVIAKGGIKSVTSIRFPEPAQFKILKYKRYDSEVHIPANAIIGDQVLI
tara:strand:+ start:4452 stop:4676 length:225 start_codon:yes stop_codon:yes gene_type:complete